MISKNAVRKMREIYLDEDIIIYLREMNIVTVNESQQEVQISPMVQGYVIDVDQDYFYLGLPDGNILKTVPHATVGLIEMSFAGGQTFDLDMPDSGDEVH